MADKHQHQWQLGRIYYNTFGEREGAMLVSPPDHADFACECGAFKSMKLHDLLAEIGPKPKERNT